MAEEPAAVRILALVPAFNPAMPELAATLKSLHEQTVGVDICVVDDGSRVPLAPLLAGESVHCLRLQVNGGITAALREGVRFALASGYDFIARLDVGDRAYPKRLERQLAHMLTHPEIDIVGAFSQVVDPAGRPLHLHGVKGGPAMVARYLYKNAPFKHSTFFIRTESLRRLGNYDEAFTTAQDYELLLRTARHGNADCLEDVLIDYLDDPSGISTRRRENQLRMRLKAQLKHAQPLFIGWYAGIGRTLMTILIPRSLAKRLSLAFWGRTSILSNADRP